jgi:hypothetical protein
MAQLSKQVEKKGPFTIVRNGLQASPQPHTTQMVRNGHFGETTTAGPSEMQFELDGSFLETGETGAGQRFVSVPDTPFEMDMHVLSSRHRQPKVRIELQRGEGSQVPTFSFNAFGPSTAMMGAPVPVVYPAGMVPVLNPVNTFMQNTMVTNQMAPVALQMGVRAQPDPIVAASPPRGNDEAVASAPRPVGQTATQSKPKIADADVPLSTKDTLNAPVVLPAPQIGPDSPSTSNATAKKSKGKATNNVSSSVGEAAASLGLNGTNSTLKGHIPAKAVTLRGAVIAIFLGLVVTIFFLSAVLWMLHAGIKPPDDSETREPPRPTPSYRQLLKAQQTTTSQSSTASAPSV